ncbi:hypothetical protein CEQ90_00285 [Lewinellaceae bacterium SD302]|nr:hypothetical protein CEQ90_00285 [Lewinellaceae bacterium SD302]
MINTISLSNDQKQLFLIDAKRVIAFDLETKEGVTIGLLGGQLSAISSLGLDEEKSSRKPDRPITLKLAADSQYTLAYNRSSKTLSLIGSIDIVQTEPKEDKEDPTASCFLHLISLEEKIVQIRKKGDSLVITPLDR